MRRAAEGSLELVGETETARLGAALAGALRIGEAICLSGPLGAGKSALARGLILAVSPDEGEAPSPTYTLVQTYPNARLSISHLDLYRLTSPREAYELGLEDALREGAAVIEWAERLGADLPDDRLDIDLEPGAAEDRRVATLRPAGSWKGRSIEF